LSIEYFFKGYSLKYARSGFKNHFLPGNGCGRAKIGSCVFHSSLLLYEKGPDENEFSSGPLLYRSYAYPAFGRASYFCILYLNTSSPIFAKANIDFPKPLSAF